MALTESDFLDIARRHDISDDRARYHYRMYVDNTEKAKASVAAMGYTGPSTPDHIAIKDYELIMLIGEAAMGNERAREDAIAMLDGGNEHAHKIRDSLIKSRPKKGFFKKLFG